MRKYLLAISFSLFVFFLASPSANAAIAFVQIASTTYDGTGVQNTSTTVPSVAAGNTLVAFCMSYNNGAGSIFSSIGDGVNTWVIDATSTLSAGPLFFLLQAHASNVSAGSPSVNCVASNTTNLKSSVINVSEYSGLATTNVVDATSTNAQEATQVATHGTSTTTNADDLIVGLNYSNGCGAYVSNNPDFTLRQFNNGANFVSYQNLDRIVSATGSYKASSTQAGACNYVASQAAYKAAAAAAPAAVGRHRVIAFFDD